MLSKQTRPKGEPEDSVSTKSILDEESSKLIDQIKASQEKQIKQRARSIGDKEPKSILAQVMKEQRSLSVGTLPPGLQSHILNAIRSDQMQ